PNQGICPTVTCSIRCRRCCGPADHGRRAILWAHNSHIGNAAATAMGWHGEFDIGKLCRAAYSDEAVLIGFGTDRGTVAAADDWDGEMKVKTVRPAHAQSYERLCLDSGVRRFLVDL